MNQETKLWKEIHAEAESSKAIAFVLNYFPILSETFIVKEIIELKSRGLLIHTYSLFEPRPDQENRQVEEHKKDVFYLISSLKPFGLFFSHILFSMQCPVRYWQTLGWSFKHREKGHSLLRAFFRLLIKKELPKNDRQDLLLHFILAVPLAREMQPRSFALIHAHFMDAATSFAMLASRLLDIPFSISAHAYDIFVPQENARTKLQSASAVVTCTHFNKQYIADHYQDADLDKIRVIYHGINLDKFNPPKRRAFSGPPVILSVGRLVPKKGFPVLLRACKVLAERGIDFVCRIIGEGPERPRLEMYIKLNNLVNHVTLIGAVAPDQMVQEYQNSTLFVLPCVEEENGNRDGIPNVLAEAMAMTLPVISSSISGIPELIENGKQGILLEPGSVPELAEDMADLLDSPRKRREMGQKGRQRVEAIFDSKSRLDELADWFREQVS